MVAARHHVGVGEGEVGSGGGGRGEGRDGRNAKGCSTQDNTLPSSDLTCIQ